MRALKIDSRLKEVSFINLENDTTDLIAHLPQARYIEAYPLKRGVFLIVDEEGQRNNCHGFVMGGLRFYGNGVITKVNIDGDTIDLNEEIFVEFGWWGVAPTVLPSNESHVVH